MPGILDYLPFISGGWNYDASRDIQYTNITKNQPVSNSTPNAGWFYGLQGVVNDSTVEITMMGDNFDISFTPEYLKQTGLTTWNPVGPYLGSYKYTSGTKGTFSVIFAPANPLPISKQLSWSLQLGSTSTQSSATGVLSIVFILLYDPQLFLTSYRSVLESVGLALPTVTQTTTNPPPTTTTTTTTTSIPRVRTRPVILPRAQQRRVMTEEQELARES